MVSSLTNYGTRSERRSSRLAVDSYIFPLSALISPGHARRVVSDAETAALVQQDHATVSVAPVFQILHGFLDNCIWRSAGAHAVGSPLGQDQFHDGLTPSSAGTGCAHIVRITAAADERRVAHASGVFIE